LASVPESPLKWRLKAFEAVAESAPLGEIADEQTAGCAFASRCPFAQEICRTERPPLRTVASGAQVACHFWEEAALPAGRAEPAGSLAANPFRVEDGWVCGPGIFDMKGGIVQGLAALSLVGLDGVRVLLTGDEELGSQTSRPLIEQLAREVEVVLVLEPPFNG